MHQTCFIVIVLLRLGGNEAALGVNQVPALILFRVGQGRILYRVKKIHAKISVSRNGLYWGKQEVELADSFWSQRSQQSHEKQESWLHPQVR